AADGGGEAVQGVLAGAERVGDQVVATVGGGLGQAGDHVATAGLEVLVASAAGAEGNRHGVRQLAGEAQQELVVGGAGEVVAVTGRGEAVVEVGRQAVALADVVHRTVGHLEDARDRSVTTEGLHLGGGGRHVDGPVVIDLVVTAGEHRGVVHRGFLRGHQIGRAHV